MTAVVHSTRAVANGEARWTERLRAAATPRERARIEAVRAVEIVTSPSWRRAYPRAHELAVECVTDEIEARLLDGAQTLEALERLIEARVS